MHAHAAPNPGIHADKTLRLNLLDVNRVRPVQNGQMAGEAGLMRQVAHDRQSHSANIQPAQRSAAQAEDLQAHAVLSRLGIASQIALGLERAQDVTGGTLWNVEFAADFGIAQAIGYLGNGFQHGQSAFNGGRGRIG